VFCDWAYASCAIARGCQSRRQHTRPVKRTGSVTSCTANLLMNDSALHPSHHSDCDSQRWSVPPARCGYSWPRVCCSNACSRSGRFGNFQQVRYWKFTYAHAWTLIFAVLLSHAASCWMPFSFARPPSLFLCRLGTSPLHQAAMNGHLSVVQMLVAANSDVNIQCR
jgi:hypothetical protein